MHNSFQARLADLRRDYVVQLADRVVELTAAYDRFASARNEHTATESLRLVAHKIAGSGATFGFDEITDAGRSLEARLNELIDLGLAGDDAQFALVGNAYERLVAACSVPSGNADSAEPVASSADSEEEREQLPLHQLVIASANRTAELDELANQIGFFGYEITFVTTPSALRLFAESNPDGIAVIHTDFLSIRGAGSDELAAIRREVKHEFHHVFISDRSDYHARLAALRAGGEAFFLMPIEITRLLDSLETLGGHTEVEPYHVLIVDDDPEQVSYYALVLQQAGMITSVASDPKTILDLMAESKPELILMDMYMPGCTGSELLSIIRQQEAFVGVPVVFLSVEGDSERQLQAIRKGADGFITKPADPDYLVATVTNRLSRTRSLRYFMERDSLTGLLNHSNLREQLLRESMRAGRTSTELCFAMIDLDHFKHVNDTHGHLTGDKVLKCLSRILQERLRRTDIIGRYGGEEFGIILLNTDEAAAARILNEIRENFGLVRHQGETGSFFVTFSCGIAGFPAHGDVDSLTVAADTALYRAKESGRNRVAIASEADR